MAGVARAMGVDTLIDVGANRGQFGQLMRRGGFEGEIVSLEPVADAFARLAAASAGDPRWTALKVAAGAHAGSLTMHVAGNSVSSSFLPMGERHREIGPETAYTRDEEVPVTTVADLLESRSIDPRTTMLKADVQGFEAAVLDGAGDHLGAFAVLQLELSMLELYEGQPLLPELVQRLDAAGHALWTFFPAFYDRANGRMWWADGLFVRKDLAAAFPYRGTA
jgi:FkbM family methyltransferase